MKRNWPEFIAALAPPIIFWRLVFGVRALYWGLPALQFVPWRVLVNEALRDWRLPLWTPLLGMGAPLMANHQSAVFYPPNLLALIAPPEYAVGFLAVLHLSFAGVGMVRLARRVGLNDFGAAVAGLTFGLSGYLTGRLWFITINNALAWLPWILLYLTPPFDSTLNAGGSRSRLRRFLLLTLLLTLQLLAGHAQSTFYTLLLAGAWIIWRSLSFHQSLRSNLKSLISNLVFFALALLFALALAAIQLIPTYELLRQSPRAAAAEYEFAMTYSLWPWRLLSWIIPNLFGHPADHNYWGYAAYWEDNAYMGLLPLVFALYAVYHVLRIAYRLFLNGLARNTKYEIRDTSAFISLICFISLISFISILLALGQNTPIFPFFYRYVPGFGLFQAPARMLIGFTFAASLLAGVGAHEWQASERKQYWSRLGLAGSGAMFILGLAGYLAIDNARATTIGSGLASAAVFALGVFILLLLQPGTPGKWRWVALALIAVDLGLAAVRLNPTIDPALYHLRPSTLPTERTYQFADDEHHVKFREFFRFTSFDDINPQKLRDSHLPNLNALNGVASANNFDPLLPARYTTFVKAMEQDQNLFALANVRTLIKRVGAVSALDSGDAAPFRIVHQARSVTDGEAALAAIIDPTFDPATEVILEPMEPERYGWPLDPNRTVIAYTGEAGYVMLADTYYPGWRAWVDGVEQPVLRADYSFKAVAVPAGTHEVVFEYAPFSVTLGLIISGVALVVWALLLGLSRQ